MAQSLAGSYRRSLAPANDALSFRLTLQASWILKKCHNACRTHSLHRRLAERTSVRPHKFLAEILIFCLLVSPASAVQPRSNKPNRPANSSDVQTEKVIDLVLSQEVKKGNLAGVKALLEKGASPNAFNSKGTRALTIAAYKGSVDITKLLLDKGANPNLHRSDGLSTLRAGIASRNKDIYELLRKYKADFSPQEKAKKIDKLVFTDPLRLLVLENTKSSPLVWAGNVGNLEEVRSLIKSGADLNAKNTLGYSALLMASERGHSDVAKALIEAGADVNTARDDGVNPLFLEAQRGNIELVKLLVSKGAKVNSVVGEMRYTPLYVSIDRPIIKHEHIETAKFLIERGADVNAQTEYGSTPLIEASQRGLDDVVTLLLARGADVHVTRKLLNISYEDLRAKKKPDKTLEDSDYAEFGDLALHYAVRGGYTNITKALLTSGANANAKTHGTMMLHNGDTVLTTAVKAHKSRQENGVVDNSEIIQLLLAHGADVNAGEDNALVAAVKAQDLAVVQLLLDRGIHVNRPRNQGTKGWTALHEAASKGNIDIIRALIKAGAVVNSQTGDYWKSTPLVIAVGTGHIEPVKLLLDTGADINLPGWNDETPLFSAVEDGQLDMVRILLSRGAKPDVVSSKRGTLLNVALKDKTPNADLIELLRSRGVQEIRETGATDVPK